MSEAIELDMSALHAMTSKSLMTTSANEDIVRTGTYVAKVTKAFPKQMPDDADFDAGRVVISFSVSLYQEDGVTKVGSGFLQTSPEERYSASGRLDNSAKRYAELAKAVGTDGSNPGEVVAAALQSAFKVRVSEQYRVENAEDLAPAHSDAREWNGSYFVVVGGDDDASREHYQSLGLESKVKFTKVLPLS